MDQAARCAALRKLGHVSRVGWARPSLRQPYETGKRNGGTSIWIFVGKGLWVEGDAAHVQSTRPDGPRSPMDMKEENLATAPRKTQKKNAPAFPNVNAGGDPSFRMDLAAGGSLIADGLDSRIGQAVG